MKTPSRKRPVLVIRPFVCPRIVENDFCDLDIPPSAEAELGLPPNDPRAPVVLLNSTGMRVTDSDCAAFFQLPEDPSNTIDEDDDDSDSDRDD